MKGPEYKNIKQELDEVERLAKEQGIESPRPVIEIQQADWHVDTELISVINEISYTANDEPKEVSLRHFVSRELMEDDSLEEGVLDQYFEELAMRHILQVEMGLAQDVHLPIPKEDQDGS